MTKQVQLYILNVVIGSIDQAIEGLELLHFQYPEVITQIISNLVRTKHEAVHLHTIIKSKLH